MTKVLLYPDHSAKVRATAVPYPDMTWNTRAGEATDILPPSIRYYNPSTGALVLERPPTRAVVEFINLQKIDAYRAKDKPREQYEIPVPWQTYYAITYNRRIISLHIGFHSQSISTGEEVLRHFPLPNMNETLVCGAKTTQLRGVSAALESINDFWNSGFNVNARAAIPPRGTWKSRKYSSLFNVYSWSEYFQKLEDLSIEEVLEYVDTLNRVTTFSHMIDKHIRTNLNPDHTVRQLISNLNSL